MLTKINQQGNVISLWFNHMQTDKLWFMLRSDAHHDSAHCNRQLERKQLDQAMDRNALILDGGDLFDAMQGKQDKRRDLADLRPEYKGTNYFNLIVDDAYEFYKPYAANWLLLGKGNHESAVTNNTQIDLTSILASKLHDDKSPCIVGGYGGWIVMYFISAETTGNRSALRLKYFHGGGGNAPVTKGVIQTNRQAVYTPDADIVWNGHNHQEYILSMKRERISSHGKLYYDLCHYVRTPGYKDDYNDSASGWAAEKGFGPAPHGCAWMRVVTEDKKPRVMIYADVV